jgi:hypothetical protein
VLPRTWKKGDGTPGVIWFYPREYATTQAYERSKWGTNINQFPAVPAARPATATELWVAGGYVFIEPDLPIYGDSGRMNDNYTRDLKENLDAVVDAMVDSGFVARDKFGIGGHSYGAFSTVNAMTLVPYAATSTRRRTPTSICRRSSAQTRSPARCSSITTSRTRTPAPRP